jgi:capsular exopolysaccharide synthesis family protein
MGAARCAPRFPSSPLLFVESPAASIEARAFKTRDTLGLEDERPSTLRDYLHLLWRNKWIVLLVSITIPLTAVFVSRREAALYQASAEVLLHPENLAANVTGIEDPNQFNPSRTAATQAQIARVPEVARRTLAAEGLKDRSPSDLIGASTVSTDDESDILTFTVADPSRALPARLANEYARQYILYREELDAREIRAAREATEARIAELEASGDTRSALHATLTEKAQQLDALETLQTPRADLVRPATGAAQIEPQPMRNAILGLALGVLLGLGLAFLREALNTRVRSAETIARQLDLPVLARIPHLPRSLRRPKGLLVEDGNRPQTEAFRILRANFDLANMSHSARRVMVTSAVENEGKSTTVANLGLALARTGQDVILVDLDLRKASLHDFFNIDPHPALSDVALRRVPLEEAIVRIDIENESSRMANGDGRDMRGSLRVLPAGAFPPNPDEFLAGPAIDDILRRLEVQSGLVLIDGPPLLTVADALAVSSKVNALLVVARLNFVRDQMLNHLAAVLRTAPPAKLGLVITWAELERGYEYLTSAAGQRRPASDDFSAVVRQESLSRGSRREGF